MDNTNFNPDAMVTRPEPKGPVFGIIIIIVLLIIGGVYVFLTGGPEDERVEDPIAEEISTQSTSTDLSDIEADVLDSDFENLDASLDALETEVSS